MSRMDELSRQDGVELLASLSRVVRDSRALTAELLAHLAVADARRLHLQEACASLHEYCVRRLGLDEETAWRYVGVARLVVRFPVLLELLAVGDLHVSGVRLLAPWLKDERADEGALDDLIRAACGKTRKEISHMLADRFPQRSIPTLVTPLGSDGDVGRASAGDANGDSQRSGTGGDQDCAGGRGEPSPPRGAAPPLPTLQGEGETGAELDRGGPQPGVSPLGARRYRVQFTASEALVAKLEEAQTLLSHTVAKGDLPALIGLALEVLCQQTLKKCFGVGSRRKGAASTARPKQGLESGDDGRGPGGQSSRAAVERLDPDPVEMSGDSEELGGVQLQGGRLSPGPDAASDDPKEPSGCAKAGRLDPDPVDASGSPAGPSGGGEKTGRLDPDPVPVRGSQSAPAGSGAGTTRASASARIPLRVRAEVYLRDGGRCTFVDDAGRRCDSRSFLQLDHVTMACRGGAPTAQNCRLLCGPHNRAEARRLLGDDFVEEKVRDRTGRRRRAVEPAPRPLNRALLGPASWPWDDPLLHQILDALDGRALSIEDLWQTPGLTGSMMEVSGGVYALAWQQRVTFLPGRRRIVRTDQEHVWESTAGFGPVSELGT
ncbi:MAG: hypothetical protein AMXMBFR64_16480 [Myxococcales bacterium]